MNKIQELLVNFCPNGVPMELIGNLINYEQPSKYLVASKTYDDSFSTPVLTAGQTFLLGYTSEENAKYPASPQSPVIIFDDFTTAYKWVDFEFKVKSSAMKMLTVKPGAPISLRYFWYALSTIRIDTSEHTRYWISKFSTLEIPLPPIEIQEEIVRMLDQFTQLEAELEAELAARKLQYVYFREYLLSDTYLLQHGAVETTLGKVGTFVRGKGIQKADLLPEGLPAIHYGQIHAYYGTSTSDTKSFVTQALWGKSARAKPGDLVIATTSESVEDVCKATVWLGQTEVAVSGDAMFFSHNLDPLFATYFFQSHHFGIHKPRISTGTKVKRISGTKMSEIPISVPPLGIQKEIGSALHTLDSLTSSAKDGIPAEISERRRQYEYYRSKLLTFDNWEVA